jgi:[acyl-carrier-protein] S-malonyltransferase
MAEQLTLNQFVVGSSPARGTNFMRKTALLFVGQGAQVVGMGRDLAEKFRSARQLAQIADDILGFNLSKICFEGPLEELTRTEFAQPGIYLASWMAWAALCERYPRLEFHGAAGLSLGEFTALSVAGAASFEQGLRLVRARGQFMQEACEVTHGGMAAILGLDEAATRSVCEATGVTLANLNCPGQIVISGAADRIPDAVALALKQGARKAVPLVVAGAYHSPLMASAQPKLAQELAQVHWSRPRVTVIANVDALPHQDTSDITRRLVEQVVSPVRWEDSIREFIRQGYNSFIELGPGNALSGFQKRIDKSVEMLRVSDLESLDSTFAALQMAPSNS